MALLTDAEIKLTPAQYAEAGGKHCPACGKKTTQVVVIKHDDEPAHSVTADILCANPECAAVWTETYRLSGYSDLVRLP